MDTNGKDFSFDRIEGFDEHIALSVPAYKDIQRAVRGIVSYFLDQQGSVVYDLGCSTGETLRRLAERFGADHHYVGFDISQNLLPARSEPPITYHCQDITQPGIFMTGRVNVIISLFTLQFLSIEARPKVLKAAYDALKPNGALIVTEKVYLPMGLFQEIFTFSHYDMKAEHFTHDQILEKQFVLRQIMKPLSEAENLQMFYAAGFTKVETFYQNLNFKGWLCVK
ncbi:carboxy-S-adenosyl-L-methionine synthase CmoA [Telluribacter humicola]